MHDDRRKTILLVEDEMIIALTEKQQLEKEGYTVIQASGGDEAIRFIDSNPEKIDLILMDIDLGAGMDGTETAARILEKHVIPVLFVSSHSEKDIVKKTEKITSYGYVIKNSNITILDASIKMAFRLFDAHAVISEQKAAVEGAYANLKAADEEFAAAHQELLVSEQLLAKSELRYHSLFTEMLEGFALHEIICDGSGKPVDYRYIDVNPAFEKMTGLSRQNIIGKTVLELMPKTESYWIEKYGRIALTGESDRFENFSAELGRYYRVVSFCPARGQFAVLVDDVTDQRKVADDLQKTTTLLEQTFEQSPVPMMLVSMPDAVIKFVNPAAREFLGLNDAPSPINAPLSGYPFPFQDYDPEGRLGAPETLPISRALRGEKTFAEERRIVRRDGTVGWELVSGTPIRDGTGEIIAGYLVMIDITVRKKALTALTENEYKFRYLVNDMQVGVMLQGPRSEILLSNPKALELLGLTEDQILGHTSFDPSWNVIHEDGSPFPGPDHPVPTAIATAQPVHNAIMGVFRPVTGDRIWLSVDAEPDVSGDGSVSQVVCTFTDITERKAAEDKVQNLLREKELILKEVHHRIKNNMFTIFGLLSLQADSQTDEKTKSVLLESACRVQSMMVLYDKLYRSEANGSLSIQTYIPALLKEITGIFPSRRHINVTSQIDDIVLPIAILSPLGIILNELMTNAMKYAFADSTDARITVTARKLDDGIVIEFADNGIGLSESVSFDNSSGFGMQLIKSLIDQIKGTITIKREQGTCYRMVLEADHE